MAIHLFWEGYIENQRGEKLPINVHTVGMSDDVDALKDHLMKHNFRRAKNVHIQPYQGLVNFHAYPVRDPSRAPHTALNDAGELVNATTGEILDAQGNPAKAPHNDLIKQVGDSRSAPPRAPQQPTFIQPK